MVDLKLIATVLKEAGRADLQLQLLELSEKLREKEDRIHALEREVRSLREASELRARVHLRNEMYYVQLGDGSEDGPMCTRCFDVDGKLVRVQVADRTKPMCPECKTHQGPRTNRPRQTSTEPYDPLARLSSH